MIELSDFTDGRDISQIILQQLHHALVAKKVYERYCSYLKNAIDASDTRNVVDTELKSLLLEFQNSDLVSEHTAPITDTLTDILGHTSFDSSTAKDALDQLRPNLSATLAISETLEGVSLNTLGIRNNGQNLSNSDMELITAACQNIVSYYLSNYFLVSENTGGDQAKAVVEYCIGRLIDSYVKGTNLTLQEAYGQGDPTHLRGLPKPWCPKTFQDTDQLKKFLKKNLLIA